ncbi:SEC-C motif domain protein [Glaciecola sp. 4H-3-7+YE-5]|nr:SEC-C motif domain protein [Glaciecola sp. 4H-3-7+YE-5]
MNVHLCFCGSELHFAQCCQPYLQGLSTPSTPEQLMRSRYSAYASGHFQYVLDTYTQSQRQTLTLDDLIQSSSETQWLRLDVLDALVDQNGSTAQVEFIAYYRFNDEMYKMHERSTFHLEDNIWRYDSGTLFEDSGIHRPQRNDICLCGSGKKYKKCCLS